MVPNVVDELSSKRVITTEYVYGETLDKALALDQPTRDYVCPVFVLYLSCIIIIDKINQPV